MRKRASAAALGIRLTVLPVLAVILIASAAQVLSFLATRNLWTAENRWDAYSFEWILDEKQVALHGKLSFIWILCALGVTSGTAKSRIGYTIRRLRIGENEVTAIWALLFSGYFLISWAVQLALVLGMFVPYAQATGLNAMDLFVANFRSAYFHTLLPLAEPWGYVRNIVLCLGWGTMAALLGRYTRHGGKVYLAFLLVIVSGLMLPSEIATLQMDVTLCIAIVALVIIQIVSVRGLEEDED